MTDHIEESVPLTSAEVIVALQVERDALRKLVRALQDDRNALLTALAECAVDIEELMRGQYGDTAIMPLSHDRARRLLAVPRP